MLRLNNVTIDENHKHILENASVDIETGSFTHIKTTDGGVSKKIFNIITGLDKVESGDVIVEGQNISKLRDIQISWLRIRKMGLIDSIPQLIEQYSVYQNIELALILIGVPSFRRRARINELLHEFDLINDIQRKVSELSLSKKQLVSICCALANDSDIIVATEPALLLSRKLTKKVYGHFAELSKINGKTIIIVSYRDDVESFSNATVSMVDTKLVSTNNVSNLVTDEGTLIAKTRIATIDRILVAIRVIQDKWIRAWAFIILSSIGISASILISFVVLASGANFNTSLSSVIDIRQVEVGHTSDNGRLISLNDDSHNIISNLNTREDIDGLYINHKLTVNSIGLVDVSLEDENKVLSAITNVPIGGQNYSWTNLQTDSIDGFIDTSFVVNASTLPATQKDIDAARDFERDKFKFEYNTSSAFWEKEMINLVQGNYPKDVPLDPVTYQIQNNMATINNANIPEVVITKELAFELFENITNSSTFSNKPDSYKSLINRWILTGTTYDQAIDAYNTEFSKDALKSYTAIDSINNAAIGKIVGIIDAPFVPNSHVYHTKSHMEKLRSLIREDILNNNIDRTFTNIDSYVLKDFSYSLVLKDLNALLSINEYINSKEAIIMLYRERYIDIVAHSSQLIGALQIAENAMLGISIMISFISFAIITNGSRKLYGVMKYIGTSKANIFFTSQIQILFTWLTITLVSTLLIFIGVIWWNATVPNLAIVYSFYTSISRTLLALFITNLISLPITYFVLKEHPLKALKAI